MNLPVGQVRQLLQNTLSSHSTQQESIDEETTKNNLEMAKLKEILYSKFRDSINLENEAED